MSDDVERVALAIEATGLLAGDEARDCARAAIAALPSADEVRDAAVKLALAAGKLNVALDGQEKYRHHRQAVLDAMSGLSAALGGRHG